MLPPASRLHEDTGVALVLSVTAAASASVLVPLGLYYLGAWLLARPAEWWGQVAAIALTAAGLVVMGLGLEWIERAGLRRRPRVPVAPEPIVFPRPAERMRLRGMGRTRIGGAR